MVLPRHEGRKVVVDWTMTTVLDKGQPHDAALADARRRPAGLWCRFKLHDIAFS